MLLEIVVGAAIGLLVGMTGLGGAMLLMPLLILVFAHQPAEAVGITLIFVAITKGSALYGHWKRGNINFNVAKHFLYGSMPAGFAASYVISVLSRNAASAELLNNFLLTVIGILLIIFSFFFFFESMFMYEKRMRNITLSKGQVPVAIASGILCGALIGATSVGAASLVALVLALVFRIKSTEIVGTDLFITMVVSALAAFTYLYHDTVQFSTVLPFLIGSLPMTLLGTRFTELARGKPLRVLISSVVFIGGFVLLYSIFT